MSLEQLQFLLSLIQTKGIAFPLDQCRIAADTLQALQDAIKNASQQPGDVQT